MKRLNQLFMTAALVVGTLLATGGQEAKAAATDDFSDVSKSHAYYNEIMYLKERGVIQSVDKFNPNDLATRQQVILMIGRSLGLDDTPRKTIFKDVTIVNKDSGVIQSAYEAGIAKGYPGNILKGYENVSRGHIAAFIARGFEDRIEVGKYPIQEFKDVRVGTTEYEPVRLLTSAGVINGYGDGTFKPNQKVSRQHVATMLARALGYKDLDAVEGAELKLIKMKNSEAILVRTDKNAFLINSGLESDVGELIANLQQLKVKKLDYVVVTNEEATSYEAIPSIHKKIPVGVIFYGGTSGNSALATSLAVMKTNYDVDAALLEKGAFLAIQEKSKTEGFEVTQGILPILEAGDVTNSSEVALTLHYNGMKITIDDFMSNARNTNETTYTLK
ncbi:S-layer homology domain-containing protein [Lysinibacillus sphaericus]|uniref:S-layer homology domain-containing protein n=1 Tax=Lysinibacillus sphaericus TaxID=1421 RepID=UPI0018CF3E49|nr:S-layer homology domain-containing protein [Lysinibacillus sphaericus]